MNSAIQALSHCHLLTNYLLFVHEMNQPWKVPLVQHYSHLIQDLWGGKLYVTPLPNHFRFLIFEELKYHQRIS